MDTQQISRNALARAIDTRFEVIDKWYKGNVEKIDADILARICFVLNCEPQDIVRYQKDAPC
ncbi:MAG: helix-turn-helix transcriptional regulator [Lachnospiraceae bacterium]|nr:helix-turn-helix transcriptional regulator [Lachnospiraceae bacterium]